MIRGNLTINRGFPPKTNYILKQKGLVDCEICGEQSGAWSRFPVATWFSSLSVSFHTQNRFIILIRLLSYVERPKTTLEPNFFLKHRTALNIGVLSCFFLFIKARRTSSVWELSGKETFFFLASLRQCLSLYDLYTLSLLMLPNFVFSKVSHHVFSYYSKYRAGKKFANCTALFSFSRPKNHLKFSSQAQPYQRYSVFFLILRSK